MSFGVYDVLQVTQLTGFSDPVYAEAYVHVNQYDIVLDVLVVNQTNDTLQNCTLELATLGEVLVYSSYDYMESHTSLLRVVSGQSLLFTIGDVCLMLITTFQSNR